MGQRSSSMAEAWPLPSISSFCRLVWSTWRDRRDSGPELLPGNALGPASESWVLVLVFGLELRQHLGTEVPYLYTQLSALFLSPIDPGHSLQGLEGEVQPSRGGVPAG